MSLALTVKQIAQIPPHCSVCQAHGGYVALPPFRDAADRRCRDHLWADWSTPLKSKFSGVVPPASLDEAAPGAPETAPSVPVSAGRGVSFPPATGDLFGGL